MKLTFSILFIVCMSFSLVGKELNTQYVVKTKGVVIGELFWNLKLSNKDYETTITLKNKGILSALYKFNGAYMANGKIIQKKLVPKIYNQMWKTKRKTRIVKIIFNDYKIKKLSIVPEEKELPRVQYEELQNYSDPLTSFVKIILYGGSSYTIDGRRIYKLVSDKSKNKKKILIKDYKNIWADHKRNDLEYLEIFFNNKEDVFPEKIKILFKGSVFSLIKA
tara:strand:- start:761 stop:1423 length:663 start_codon:yes stop_codon:yes gene_type:complete